MGASPGKTASGGFGRLAGAEAGLSWGPSLGSAVPKAILSEWLQLEQKWYVPGELCPEAALAGVATRVPGETPNDIAGFPEFGKGPSSFPSVCQKLQG